MNHGTCRIILAAKGFVQAGLCPELLWINADPEDRRDGAP